MNRVHLWLAGLQILSLAAIGWLWSENQSLRAHSKESRATERRSAASPTGPEGRFAGPREPVGSPKLGTPNRSPADPRKSTRSDKRDGETSPGSPVLRKSPSSLAGGISSKEMNLPTEEPPLPETGLIAAPPPPGADSLLVNGGFDGELAPWLCEEGRVIPDPDDARNSLLEANPNESGFRLAQSFQPPAENAPLILSFRAQWSGETALSGFDLVLLGPDDKPLTMTLVEAGKPGEWKKIEWRVSTPVAPASLRIGSSDGKGAVRIDDVKLEPSSAARGTAQGQAP